MEAHWKLRGLAERRKQTADLALLTGLKILSWPGKKKKTWVQTSWFPAPVASVVSNNAGWLIFSDELPRLNTGNLPINFIGGDISGGKQRNGNENRYGDGHLSSTGIHVKGEMLAVVASCRSQTDMDILYMSVVTVITDVMKLNK